MKILHHLKRNETIVIIFICTLAFVSRIIYINFNPIGHDEPFSIFHAQMTPSEIIKILKAGNNPPLYELFLHYWIKLFGIGSLAVRIPSLVFNVLNILFVFLITKRYFNLRSAILASLFMIFSSYHMYFAYEARVYSLFSLLTTLGFYFIFEIINGKTNLQHYLLLFLIYVSLIYSHYLGFGVFLFQIAILIIFKREKNKDLKYFMILIFFVLISFSFYLPILYHRLIDYSTNGSWLKPVENLGNLHHMIYIFSNKNKYLYLFFISLFWFISWKAFNKSKIYSSLKFAILYLVIPFFFLVSFSIFFSIPFIWKITSQKIFYLIYILLFLIGSITIFIKKIKDYPNESIVFMWFIIPFITLFSISFFIPLFHDRYLIFIISAFYIGFAIIIDKHSRGIWFYVISVIVLLLMVISADFKRKDNIGNEEIAETAKSLTEESSKVLICPENYKITFLYHYDKNLFKDYKNLALNLKKENIIGLNESIDAHNLKDPSTTSIIFIDADSKFIYPNNTILDSLKSNYTLIKEYKFNESLYLYSH